MGIYKKNEPKIVNFGKDTTKETIYRHSYKIVRNAERMNSDIHIIDMLSEDPADCSPYVSSGNEWASRALAVFVTDSTSML